MTTRVDRINRSCWIWERSSYQGYGTMQYMRKRVYVHRAVYEFLMGPIPDGLVLDHLCCTKRCYNPRHLEPVTRAENTRRCRPSYREQVGANLPQ